MQTAIVNRRVSLMQTRDTENNEEEPAEMENPVNNNNNIQALIERTIGLAETVERCYACEAIHLGCSFVGVYNEVVEHENTCNLFVRMRERVYNENIN